VAGRVGLRKVCASLVLICAQESLGVCGRVVGNEDGAELQFRDSPLRVSFVAWTLGVCGEREEELTPVFDPLAHQPFESCGVFKERVGVWRFQFSSDAWKLSVNGAALLFILRERASKRTQAHGQTSSELPRTHTHNTCTHPHLAHRPPHRITADRMEPHHPTCCVPRYVHVLGFAEAFLPSSLWSFVRRLELVWRFPACWSWGPSSRHPTLRDHLWRLSSSWNIWCRTRSVRSASLHCIACFSGGGGMVL